MAKKTTTDDIRMPLTSPDVLGERVEQLRDLVPEAFVEGKIDFDRLKAALGGLVDESRERYGLSWAGKADAIRAIQAPSVGTLVPCPQESINFDTTENLFIEGDNLEVLKLLQKSYYGKVKMIYIDPPYNTGGEFIYPDNYREGLAGYLQYSGQVAEDGTLLTTRAETGGRLHSKWLDMMFPRLFLARNLLTDDGLFFSSIDDNECHNLRLLLNEVFGEENFIAQIVWKKSYGGGSKAKHVVGLHEYVLCYCRNKEALGVIDLPPDPRVRKYYKEKDDKFPVRGPYREQPLATNSMDDRPNLRFPILHEGEEIWPEKQWQWSPERVQLAQENDDLVFHRRETGWTVNYKQYLKDEDGKERGAKPFTVLDGPYTQRGTSEIKELFGNGKVYSFPKPTELIRQLIRYVHADKNAIIVDFFAGSCSTAHAVLLMNREDGGHRRFICVQLPEPVREAVALESGFETCADVGIERIRRVIAKLDKEQSVQLPFNEQRGEDLGVKALKLRSSNFKIWDGTENSSPAELQEQLELFADHVLPDRSEQDILYELMLKAGLPLTAAIEEKTVAEQKLYSIAEGLLFICLANPITQECLREMIELEPQRVICLDTAFGGNDQLKTNTVLEMKSHGIEFRTV